MPNGSIKFQLNVDATVIAAPYGFVAADIPVVFQFNAAGQIQPNPPAVAAKIWSNEELQPQLSSTLLGTYYLVTFYDQNGAVINATPLWWQFPESANATVDISQMTAISTVGGNIIYYPTAFGGGGSVTSVSFTGDGTVLSATPSTPVTVSGTITATLLTQTNNLVLAGPVVGPAGLPTFRALVSADIPVPLVLNSTGAITALSITNPTAATSLLNQSSPIVSIVGQVWSSTGPASIADTWTLQNVIGTGTNPTATLTLVHTGTSGSIAVNMNGIGLNDCGIIIAPSGITAQTQINLTGSSPLNQQATDGAQMTVGTSTELLTLSTGAAHTDSTTNLLPAGAIIDCVTIRITHTISGGSTPTTIAVGDTSTSNRFISTGTPLTATSTAVGLNQIDAGTSSQAAAAKVRITLDQIPGQGIVEITTFWRQYTAPTA